MKPPSESQRRRFAEAGACVVRRLLTQRQVTALTDGAMERLTASAHWRSALAVQGSRPYLVSESCRWETVAGLVRHLDAPRLAAWVGALCRARQVQFLEIGLMWTRTGAPPTPWHQDASYYQVDGRIVSVWIPLTRRGGVEGISVVPGSHRATERYFPVDFARGQRAAANPEAGRQMASLGLQLPPGEEAVAPQNVRRWRMSPGDVIIFDSTTLHSRRRGARPGTLLRITARFLVDEAAWRPSDLPGVFLPAPTESLRPAGPLGPELFPVLWTAGGSSGT